MGSATVLEAAPDPMGSKATLLAATGERTTGMTIQYVLVYEFVVVRAYCLLFYDRIVSYLTCLRFLIYEWTEYANDATHM